MTFAHGKLNFMLIMFVFYVPFMSYCVRLMYNVQRERGIIQGVNKLRSDIKVVKSFVFGRHGVKLCLFFCSVFIIYIFFEKRFKFGIKFNDA